MDTGAFPGAPMSIGTILTAASYKMPNFELDGYEVLTNKASVGAYRAPGAPNVAFGIEAAVDQLARKIGHEPAPVPPPQRDRGGGQVAERQHAAGGRGRGRSSRRCRSTRSRASTLGPNEGRGYAIGGWPGGAGAASAYCRANPDGTFQVITGTINLTGSTTALAQIAAEELGVPLALVTVVTGDTRVAALAGRRRQPDHVHDGPRRPAGRDRLPRADARAGRPPLPGRREQPQDRGRRRQGAGRQGRDLQAAGRRGDAGPRPGRRQGRPPTRPHVPGLRGDLRDRARRPGHRRRRRSSGS